MSYREHSVVPAFIAMLVIGFLIGIPVATAVNDNYWNKKLVKEGKYYWVVDENGYTNLVPK
jgi:hypothetical protein